MPESLPHVPITAIPAPSSTDLTDPNNSYPALDTILRVDSVGPEAANRQPKAIDKRTEALRDAINKLIDVVDALSLNFLHRDGTLKQNGTVADPSYMRGPLSMTDPTGPTLYQVKGAANGTEDQDAVTKQQLDALNALVLTLQTDLGEDFVRRDGTLAMTANLNMGGFQIINMAAALDAADGVRKQEFDAVIDDLQDTYVARDGSLTMQGNLQMGGNKISGLPTVGYPNLPQDAVPKAYVDAGLAAIAAVPAGTMSAFAGSTVPLGWVICDGRALSTVTFPALFTAIGYAHGGSGSTFNVPDLRGRSPMGMDDYGGALSSAGPANRVTSVQADVLGGSLGTETHTLTTAEIPSHTHSYTDRYFASGAGGALTGVTSPSTTTNTFSSISATTDSAGSGNAHNNMQPSIALLYIIKT
jgi:microcystin-dependent protein